MWGDDHQRLGCRRLLVRIQSLPPDAAVMRALRDKPKQATTSDMKRMFGDVAHFTPTKAE